jgi:AraC-like DNA-binding protein
MEGDAAKIFILDDRGTVISDADKASLGKNLMSVPAVGSIYGSPDKRGAFTSKITGTEYFVIYWVSELNNWYYCSFVPMTELNRRMNIISLMTATLVPAFFILTALLSYPLARRLNTPVKKMEYRLEDYKLIQILLGKPDIRRAAPGSDIPAEANPEKRFVHPCFCCAALSPDCPGHAAEKNDGGYRFNGGGSIVKLCLDALSEKVFCRGLVLEDNSIALVMNFHSADMPFIKGALKKVQEQAGAFGLSLSIGIGTVVPWEKISESYNAAQRALLNRLMEGYGCLVVYREEPKTPDYYFYPTDQENIIFNNLRLHLHDKMAAAVDDFVEKIKKQKELSIDNVILIFNQLMGSVIRYIVEMHINTREIFGNETNFYYRFSELKTIDEIQLYFKELLGRITAFELRANADSKKPIKRILNYIQSNLDKTFDINALSDSIGLSYSHVRRVFSQETGENILSYVYKMKIETAKKLLAETHLSAGEIAGKLGFYNRQSFYRFFKKFEGMTPNEFRQLS